jgi:transposase
MIIGTAPRRNKLRISSDSVWPLRSASGRTFAEEKQCMTSSSACSSASPLSTSQSDSPHAVTNRKD